jgi:vesicle-fusing ATPase
VIYLFTPKNHKLLIIATTTQKAILEQMEFLDYFNSTVYIPNITRLSEIEKVLEVNLLNDM